MSFGKKLVSRESIPLCGIIRLDLRNFAHQARLHYATSILAQILVASFQNTTTAPRILIFPHSLKFQLGALDLITTLLTILLPLTKKKEFL